jgi:D-mannonate dehydratase
MISNTSPTQGTPVPALRPAAPRKPSAAPAAATDNLSTSNLDRLKAALAATPEIRPEMVAHGVKLALDPNYPPLEIIEDVARIIVSSEDLSNRE